MADVVVLGAGVAGHTAALHLRRLLPKNNTVTVVTPNSQWNWIPSNIWVGWARWASRTSSSARARLMPSRASPMSRPSAVGSIRLASRARADSARPSGRSTAPDRRRLSTLTATASSAPQPAAEVPALPGGRPQRGHIGLRLHRRPLQSRRRPSSPRRSIGILRRAVRRRLSSAWARHLHPCEGAAFDTSSTSTTSCVRPVAPGAWLISPTRRELGDFGVGGMTFRSGASRRASSGPDPCSGSAGSRPSSGARHQGREPGVVHYETLDGQMREPDVRLRHLCRSAGVMAYARAGGSDITHRSLFRSPAGLREGRRRLHRTTERREREWLPLTGQDPSVGRLISGAVIPLRSAAPDLCDHASPQRHRHAPSPPRTGMPSGVSGQDRALDRTGSRIVQRGEPYEALDGAHARGGVVSAGAADLEDRLGGLDDDDADRAGLRPLPHRTRPQRHAWRDRPRGSLDQAHAAPPFIHKAKARFGWQFIPE